MRWSALSLVSLLGLASLPLWANAAQDYGVLIISRERLEVPTNLPAGNVGIRLKLLPGQAPGCLPGMLVPPAQQFTLKAGDVLKYRMALGKQGVYLKPAALGY